MARALRFLPLAATLLLLLLPAAASQAQEAQDLGGARPGAGAGQYAAAAPRSCPAASPGMWVLIIILAMVAALELGYILHSELTLRRARAAARAPAPASAWGYPTAPPLR